MFVFGTLKEGFPNFSINRGARVAGAFRTLAAYPLYLVGERHVPWLMNTPGMGLCVAGQLFQVDDDALAAMDKLEGTSEPDGYRRQLLELKADGSSERISAYAYLKEPAQLAASEVRAGPLGEYTLEHAMLYRPRRPEG